jgi:hypothetical protein
LGKSRARERERDRARDRDGVGNEIAIIVHIEERFAVFVVLPRLTVAVPHGETHRAAVGLDLGLDPQRRPRKSRRKRLSPIVCGVFESSPMLTDLWRFFIIETLLHYAPSNLAVAVGLVQGWAILR